MKTYLHKIPEGFVLTSDEGFKVGEMCFDITENEMYKSKGNVPANEYVLKVIAQQDQLDLSSLSEEHRKEIGWFDVEKMGEKEYEGFEDQYDKFRFGINGYVHGFQKAQELLSDKQFTLEDIERAFNVGANAQFEKNTLSLSKDDAFDYTEKKMMQFIKSLTKTSWEVEVEMEDVGDEDWIGDNVTGQPFWNEKLVPYFNNGKVTILKIIQ